MPKKRSTPPLRRARRPSGLAAPPVERISVYPALWYDAPLTSRDSDRMHVLLPALLAALRTLGDAPARSLTALAQRLGVAEADAATVVTPRAEESAPVAAAPAAAPMSPLLPMTGRNDASSAPKTLLNRP